ncbi:MAG: hypothetical protein JRJ59_07255, partial [Deltaproteobacteria bacterium]|nr:hypothetical protein [Deltaproteobacteria bacterium]
ILTDFPETYQGLSKSGLTSSIVAEEFSPNRIFIGTKSPLTGTVLESNPGGRIGQYLTQLGLAGIVVENQPQPGKWFKLFISKDRAELSPADDLAGLDPSAALDKPQASSGPRAAYVFAGQGQWGAVLGAKGLKAVIVDPAGAGQVPLAEPEASRAGSRPSLTPGRGPNSGTGALTGILSRAGGRLSRNLSAGFRQEAEAGPARKGDDVGRDPGQDRCPRLHNPLLRYLQRPERRVRLQAA